MGLQIATELLAADGDTVAMGVRGIPWVYVVLRDELYDASGDLYVEVSWDEGQDWVAPALVLDANLDRVEASYTLPINSRLMVPVVGPMTHLRVRRGGTGGRVTATLQAVETPGVTLGIPWGSNGGINPVSVRGDVLAGSDDVVGYPVKIGGMTRVADPPALAAAQRTNLAVDKIGRPVVAPYCLPENLLKGKTGDITDTTATTVLAAPGSGVRIYVTQVSLYNSHATVGTWVDLLDNATAIHSVYLPAAGGKAELSFPVPLQLTANQPLRVQAATTGASFRANASGYKGA